METSQFFLLLAIVMVLVLVLDLLSDLIRPTLLSEPLLALLLGVALGPAPGFGVLDLARLGDPKAILEIMAQVTLAIGLMGVALRIPPFYTLRFRRTLAILLLLGMPLMWLGASLVMALILGVPLAVALLLGAVITPTDPIVSTPIVTGRVAEEYLTKRLRYAISAESGFNDGLAYPLVALPILLFADRTGAEITWEWLREAWLIKTLAGVLTGAFFGYGAAKILHVAERHEKIEIESLLSYAVALSLASLAAAELLGANGILAVFIAGICFGAKARPGERVQQENVQEAVNRFFTLPIFFLIGLALPWAGWKELGWTGLFVAGAILFFRRLPAWILLARFTPGLRRREMVFAGWFGPIGIAALYYALHAEKETGNTLVWPLTTLIICTSVLAHGMTAAPFSRWLRGKV